MSDLEQKLKQYRPFEDTIKAREYLKRLCSGDRPTMQVPPSVDDYDMVFCRVISKCEELDTRTCERAEMQAAIVELRLGLERLRKTIEVNADDVFWMHDMGACHESAHDFIDYLLDNTKKWSE